MLTTLFIFESGSKTITMNIKAMRDGMRNVNVTGTISAIGDVREVSLRTGGQARVADATLKDATGSIKLPLWDAQIDAVNAGSEVEIANGYTTTFRGEVQLSVGRYGKLTVA